MVKKFSPVVKAAMDHYAQLSDALCSQCNNAALIDLRKQAKTRFLELGFPARRDEDWNYTPLNGFVQTHFTDQGVSHVSKEDIKAFLPPYPATRIVMIDGWFSEGLSDDLSQLPEQVSIEATQDALGFADAVNQFREHDGAFDKEPFAVLNNMLVRDGVFIQVARNTTVELPIFVLHVQSQNQHVSNLRNRVVVEENAELTVVESYVTLQSQDNAISALTNVVSEIDVARHGRLKQVVLQNQSTDGFYFNNQFVTQREESVFNTLYAGLGSDTSRHQNHLQMNGDHIESVQNSACFASGKQVMDSRTDTAHNALAGMSRQLHKYVLDGQTTGVFDGMIKVDQKAQKTDGQMDNKNLILSDSAKMDAKPKLEIYADDVQCSHGSATGQIDEDQIFYLQARGIARAQAVRMITEAFLLEPVEEAATPEIQHWVSAILAQKFNG